MVALLAISAMAGAEDKPAEKPKVKDVKDHLSVVLHPGVGKDKAVAVISATNVNPIRAFSIPLKFTAGGDSIWIDSVSYLDTRAGYFTNKEHSIDLEKSTIFIFMLRSAGDKKTSDLAPGTGEIVRLYFASKGEFPTGKFRMGPVTTPPKNTLMFVTDALAKAEPDFDFRIKGQKPVGKTLATDSAETKEK
jgi:hypothetical protein